MNFEQDHKAASAWAKGILDAPNDWCILDTETTGLHGAEMVEIAVIDLSGVPFINTLVKPTIPIEEGARNVHGIGEDEVSTAPTFAEVYEQLSKLFKERKVLIYNAEFDTQIIRNCCKNHGKALLELSTDCVMEWYAQWFGEWSDYHGSYRWQKLNGGHRALGDCQATLALIEEMARGNQ